MIAYMCGQFTDTLSWTGRRRPARRVVWLESPGTHPNREMEIHQEKYERSHYVFENTGSRFENELKTNSK